jgi:small subunit ribosomal protein S1
MIDRHELVDESGLLTVEVGDEVTAAVVSTSGGTIALRIKMGRAEGSNELKHAMDAQLPVRGTITAVNKGGVEVEMGGVRAFCPISQLAEKFVEDPATFIGQSLDFMVTRYEPEGHGGKANVVLSRRAILADEKKKRAEETRSRLSVGATVMGVVTTIKDYGAFVDLGGLEGMLHITEFGHGRIKTPADVVSVGDTLEVQITKIEMKDDRERISLSLKALKEDPFEVAAAQLTVGQVLKGEVVRVEPFGAFIELPGGAQGLAHISELAANRRVNHARDVVTVGTFVDVAVLGIDQEKRRIALSMKAVSATQEAAVARDYQPKGGTLGTFADLLKGKK